LLEHWQLNQAANLDDYELLLQKRGRQNRACLRFEDQFKLSGVSKIIAIARASSKARDEMFPPADRS
jgi:hypothetical protein